MHSYQVTMRSHTNALNVLTVIAADRLAAMEIAQRTAVGYCITECKRLKSYI